jgi:type II secretory pathway pseudopilin PulG
MVSPCFKHEKGQALLIVLLSLAVVLTVVLFVLSRSVTDIAVSSRFEEAIRAFSAAEAGVEQALIAAAPSGVVQIGNASYNVSVNEAAEGEKSFAYPLPLTAGDSVVIWFVAHDDEGNLICSAQKPCFTGDTVRFCWGNVGTESSSSVTPALEASIVYAATPGNYATLRVARVALDPNAGRRVSNSFDAPDLGACSIGGGTNSYEFQKVVSLSSLGIPSASYSVQDGLQFVRLRILYNSDVSHGVGIDVDFPNDSPLASQGKNIISAGSAGGSNRRLNVFQSWGEIPSVFSFPAFSGGSLVK